MTSIPAHAIHADEIPLDPRAFPAEIELSPGTLRARVHLHDVNAQAGRVRCWTYLSDGLAMLGQAEVALTVAVDPGGDPGRFPADPLRLFVTLASLAAQGRVVEVGGVTELGGPGFMGRRALLYASAPPLDGVPIKTGTLAIVAVTDAELAVQRAFGNTRVLAALGKAYRHYPFAPWLDRRRGDVISPQRTRGSILESVPRVHVPGSVRMEAGNILLRLRPQAAPRLAGALAGLPADAGFALLTEIDPVADGCLTWEAGQQSPAAITPPGSRGERLCGCFALFVPAQPEDGGQLFEDGLAAFLTSASAAALRGALSAQRPISLPARGGRLGVVVEWVPTEYQNPIDGSVIHASGGFHVHAPAGGPRPPATAGVVVKQIVLLTSEREISERVEGSALAAYIKGIEALAGACLAQRAAGPKWEILVEAAVAPGASTHHRIATRGEAVDGAAVADLQARLATVPPPAVRAAPIMFQVFFEIGAG